MAVALVRCIMQLAPSATRSARCRLSPEQAGLFTVRNALTRERAATTTKSGSFPGSSSALFFYFLISFFWQRINRSCPYLCSMVGEVKIRGVDGNPVVNVALDTIGIGKQALVFVGTRPGAEKSAEDIAKRVDLAGKQDEVRALAAVAESVLHAVDSPTRQCERLARCVRKGVAFHHSGLTTRQRELVEDGFRNGAIKVICSTPTLASGVDLPAFRAIIRDLKRFTRHGYDWIPVLEYHQMCGRAGRPSYDSEGQAVVFADSEGQADELEERFINGVPEEVYSKLAAEPVLRTYLLSLISSHAAGSKEEVLSFFGRTFWAYQFKDFKRLEKIIDRMLFLLENWGFINLGGSSGFVSASDDNGGRISATALGSRVAELYLDPLTAHGFVEGLKSVSGSGASDFALLQLISWSNELQPLLRVRAKELDYVGEVLVVHSGSLLMPEPSAFEPDYDDFLGSVKTALFFSDWVDEQGEESLLEKYDIRPGEVRSKLDVADWLLYSLGEIVKVLQLRELMAAIAKLRLRMRYGAREELLPLLQLKGIGRVRARRLFANRIKGIADVKAADISTLSQLIGQKVALDVKKQLAQDVKEVSEGKRTGQTGVLHY